jgi:hypothetical protein
MPPSDQLPDELNDAELRFEQSLQTLRPVPVRLDVAAALAAAVNRRNARPRTQLRHAAVAAAVLVAFGAWWTSARGPNPNALATQPRTKPAMASPVPAPPVPGSAVPASRANQPPTLMAYRQALAHSPAQLDELLDRQSATTALQTSPTPVDVFSLRHAEFLSSTGAM